MNPFLLLSTFSSPAFPPTDHQTHSFSSFITSSSSSLAEWFFLCISFTKTTLDFTSCFNSPVWLQEQLVNESVSGFQFFSIKSHISHDCVDHLKDHSLFFLACSASVTQEQTGSCVPCALAPGSIKGNSL